MALECREARWVGGVVDDGLETQFKAIPGGFTEVWSKPKLGRQYFIPADVAEGVAGCAYSVAPVFDRETWEIVAQWRGHVAPGQFGREMVKLGRYYNNALLAPELNNHGHATIEAINAENYPHLLETKELWADERNRQGFPTDARTKPRIIDALREAITREVYVENSRVAVSEMQQAIIDDHGDIVSQSGYLDCMMARAIGIYCLKFVGLDRTYRDRSKQIQITNVGGLR